MSLATILIVFVLLALLSGGWLYRRPPDASPAYYGYASWSPLGLLILLAIVLVLTGHLTARGLH